MTSPPGAGPDAQPQRRVTVVVIPRESGLQRSGAQRVGVGRDGGGTRPEHRRRAEPFGADPSRDETHTGVAIDRRRAAEFRRSRGEPEASLTAVLSLQKDRTFVAKTDNKRVELIQLGRRTTVPPTEYLHEMRRPAWQQLRILISLCRLRHAIGSVLGFSSEDAQEIGVVPTTRPSASSPLPRSQSRRTIGRALCAHRTNRGDRPCTAVPHATRQNHRSGRQP